MQQLAQCAVAAVGHRAVGHQPPSEDAVIGKPRQAALEKRDHGGRLLIIEQFAVGQPRVVIDDGVEVVVAERVGALQIEAAAVAGDRVPWAPKARVALDVHVQQIARARPFVANELLARLARCA